LGLLALLQTSNFIFSLNLVLQKLLFINRTHFYGHSFVVRNIFFIIKNDRISALVVSLINQTSILARQIELRCILAVSRVGVNHSKNFGFLDPVAVVLLLAGANFGLCCLVTFQFMVSMIIVQVLLVACLTEKFE